MTKYKIVSSTNEVYLNIEMPFDFEGKELQDKVSIFNEEFTITQTGSVVQCISEKAVMTFQEVPEPEIVEETE